MAVLHQELQGVGTELLTGAIRFLPQLLKAVLIVVLAAVVARVVVRVLRSSLALAHMEPTASGLVVSVARFSVWLLATAAILWVLGLKQVSTTLAGAGVLVALGTALASGVQGLISDVLAGMLLLADPNFAVGTAVSIGGVAGAVEEVNIRKTHVRDGEGKLHIIPNRAVDAAPYVIVSARSREDRR